MKLGVISPPRKLSRGNWYTFVYIFQTDFRKFDLKHSLLNQIAVVALNFIKLTYTGTI